MGKSLHIPFGNTKILSTGTNLKQHHFISNLLCCINSIEVSIGLLLTKSVLEYLPGTVGGRVIVFSNFFIGQLLQLCSRLWHKGNGFNGKYIRKCFLNFSKRIFLKVRYLENINLISLHTLQMSQEGSEFRCI